LSIREFAFSIAGWIGGASVPASAPVVTMTTVWVMGTLILFGSVAYSMRRLTRYEVAERL